MQAYKVCFLIVIVACILIFFIDNVHCECQSCGQSRYYYHSALSFNYEVFFVDSQNHLALIRLNMKVVFVYKSEYKA